MSYGGLTTGVRQKTVVRPIVNRVPDPQMFGWTLNGGAYEATMTNQPPVPEAVAELSFCKCKTECSSMRCKCQKSRFTCTEMCDCVIDLDCVECENLEDHGDELCPSDDEDSEEDS